MAEKKVYLDEEGNLHYDTYVTKGNMMCLREALSINDPDHLYNYVKANGITPETYGIYHPNTEQYESLSREELIGMITQLKQELENAYRYT